MTADEIRIKEYQYQQDYLSRGITGSDFDAARLSLMKIHAEILGKMNEQLEDLWNMLDVIINNYNDPGPDPGNADNSPMTFEQWLQSLPHAKNLIADLYPEMSERLRNAMRHWERPRKMISGEVLGPFLYWSDISWQIIKLTPRLGPKLISELDTLLKSHNIILREFRVRSQKN